MYNFLVVVCHEKGAIEEDALNDHRRNENKLDHILGSRFEFKE